MNIEFVGLPTEDVDQIRTTMRDAYDLPVEVHPADAGAYPCRHCLGHTPAGKNYLILAHRPFATLNPYAETGPIFLCAEECIAATHAPELPEILRAPHYIVRGYDANERIVYGSGKVTPTAQIPSYAQVLLADPDIAFADVRSAENNCFQCRIRRSS